MSTKELLAAQNWEKLTAQLSAFAWKRMGRRKDKWEDAQDIAQLAITKAFQNADGWDPEKEPLLKYLSKRVIGLVSNERSRARSSFEIAMASAPEAEDVAIEESDSPEEAIDRRRMAEIFRKRLLERIAGDEIMVAVVELLLEGIDTPTAQAKASGYTVAQMRDARRRVFYVEETLSKELAKELDDEDDEEEVAQ